MIDWDRVAELRDEIGAEDFAEVVEIFLDEVEEELAKLSDGMSTETLQATLHFLKGSALNLGFSDLSETCQRGEIAVRDNTTVALEPLRDCYAASKSAFLSGIARPDAA